MIKSILAVATFVCATSAFAGGNVALYVKVDNVKISNKASNHPEYQALELSGKVSQSDAVVNGLPGVLPENVSILFKASSDTDKFLASFCEKYASQAKVSGQSVRVDIFMSQPDHLVRLIEGGMSDSRFNSFVLKTDDPRISHISCSIK